MNWIKANAWRAVAMALAGCVAVLAVQIHGLPVIGGGLHSKLDHMAFLRTAEADSHRQTKANIRAAQAAATADQANANTLPALKSAIIAEISDATANGYYDAVLRAAGSRVQQGRSATQCAGGKADLPGADRPANSDVEDAGAARLVSDPASILVSQADWTRITVAAGQAAMCARAGQELIRQGVAVPGTLEEEMPANAGPVDDGPANAGNFR